MRQKKLGKFLFFNKTKKHNHHRDKNKLNNKNYHLSEAMNEEKESTSATDTGKEDMGSIEKEKNELNSIEEKEEEQLDTVRFQYDGTLMLDVQIESSKNELTCNREPSDFEDADSFYVIEYMTVFKVNVNLQYEILEGLYCDIVDESYEVEVTSKVGYGKKIVS